MSVENIDAAVSPSGGFPDQKENMNDVCENAEKEEQGGCPQAAASIPSVMAGELSAPIEESESEKGIRSQKMEWIDNLKENEVLRMFTLEDVPFLASLLAVSSLSSTTRGHMDRPSGTSAERPSRWLDLVGSSEIRAVHSRICDDFKTGQGVLITSRWISSIQASVGESRSMPSDVSNKSPVPDESIRIRHDYQEGAEMTDIEAFWLILEHARVVFPSALSFVTGNVTANNSTLLTFSPSILRILGARKVYDALNAGLQSILPDEEFFSSLSSEGTWVDSLLALESKEQDSLQIPLFSVLLFRLEHAFREAYQASVATFVEEAGSEMQQSDSGESQSTRLAIDSHTFVDALADRLKEFEESKIEDEDIRSITGELAKACGGSDGMTIQISDLLLSPLTLVCRSIETGGIGSLAVVDDIIKTSLERFKTISTLKRPNESGEAKSNDKSTAQVQQQKGNAKKKKKRKLKKRQGKGRVAEQDKPDNKPIADSSVVENSIAGEEIAYEFSSIEPADPIFKPEDVEEIADAPIGDEDEPLITESSAKVDPSKDRSTKVETDTEIPDEGVVVATDSGQNAKEAESATVSQVAAEGHDDGDAWETVEVKPRNQRKKVLDRSNTMSSRTSTGNSSSANDNSSKKSNKEKRTPASRKKNTTRKMVREILLGVVDSVEAESARKQKPATAPVITENRWKKGPPLSDATKQNAAIASVNESPPNRPKTLRDIVLGNSNGNDAKAPNSGGGGIANQPTGRGQQQAAVDGAKKSQGHSEHTKKRHVSDSLKKRPPSNSSDVAKKLYQAPKSAAKKHEPSTDALKKAVPEKALQQSTDRSESPSKSSPSKWAKGKPAVLADQNTAPTYQETVSAMSGTSNRVSDRPTARANQVELAKSDTSSGGTDEAPQNRERAASPVEKESASGPPLLTFVSPENANSATSSVASSLEVPHTSRRHHHSTSTPDAADVGYHLLDVCDRLSRDMRLFMSSREQAINIRRRERGAVLTALQDSLSKVWPGMCRPEMYGSCATLLDLPSSDLDVVVVGLDHSEMMIAHEIAAASQQKSKRCDSSNSKHRRSNSKDGSVADDDGGSTHALHAPPALPTHVHHAGYVNLPLYRNSERVKQLAMQIEGKPWAVKVKSLPNASVPVIKILADPSKLPGAVSGAEWPRPSPDGDDHDKSPSATISGDVSTSSGHQAPSQNLYEPWRGSDIMNGLISLDITFEGPEHGGLGSTDFSVHVVNEACQEAGGPPESTPFVQCLMVLKELLVQRKLNEPYSGGLSSYALLLLLLGLVRERALIRQEIERVECQRQAMANGSVATYAGSLAGDSVDDSAGPPSSQAPDALAAGEANNTSVATSTRSLKHANSWASIAKKPSNTPTPSVSSEKRETKPSNQSVKPTLHRPASFADAVARRSNATSISDAEEKRGDEQENPAPGDSSAAASVQKEPVDPNGLGLPSFYPQGFDDVIEVLCTGETTAGKLLMHFLLYYGQYFDAQATAIDISGKHERVFMGHPYSPYSYLSPYIPRRAPETIDPHTGMLVVDHIVIYDPLEGAENNNVARRCFAWQQVKWIFAQSYATLSSAVERSSSPPATPNGRPAAPVGADKDAPSVGHEMAGGDLMDPSSPLLRCLLSF